MTNALPSADRTKAPWVLVSAGFHDRGGQSRANAALADYLLARGTPVHLVGHDIDARFRSHPKCRAHSVRRPGGTDLIGVFRLRREGSAIAKIVRASDARARILVNGGCCHSDDVNWVHYVHNGWQAVPRGAPTRHRLKETLAGFLFRRHERHALAAARLVLANSEQTRSLLIDRLGLPPDRVHTVYLGSDPSWKPASAVERSVARNWLGYSDSRPLVVFVGGLGYDERKGFDTLWKAWQFLCGDRSWDVDLIVAGGGAGSAAWECRAADGGLSKRIRFVGFTDRIFDLLGAADLLVSPARYEPYGLNVHEALCRGVPALVSACAGVVEQYSSNLGDMILPDPDDWRDLAARLRKWRSNITMWRDKFHPLGAKLLGYSWSEMAAHIVSLAEGISLGSTQNDKAGSNRLFAN